MCSRRSRPSLACARMDSNLASCGKRTSPSSPTGPRARPVAEAEVGRAEVVEVTVVAGLDLDGALEQREGLWELAAVGVELGEELVDTRRARGLGEDGLIERAVVPPASRREREAQAEDRQVGEPADGDDAPRARTERAGGVDDGHRH